MVVDTEEFYTAQEVADKLKVNVMTVYRHINSGKLNALKTGKDFRVKKADFEDYIANSQQGNPLEDKENQILILEKEIARLKNNIKKQRYGLVWVDVPEAFEADSENQIPVLKEDPELAIENKDGKPAHILIEGDNYHALTCLNYTHKGKVDFIYIDPPYNTGSDGFRYKDKRVLDRFPDGTLVPTDSPYRHSYWLSFMRKRLELSKELLTDTGVIFVSIDDNELSQLKLLLDEVFDKNFVAQFIHKNNSSKNQANLVSVSTEYLLCYSKNPDALKGVKWRVPKKGADDIVRTFKKLKQQGLSLEDIESEIKSMYSRPKYAHLSRWNKVDDDGVFVDADLSRENGRKDYTIVNPSTGKECLVPSRGWGKSKEELLRLQQEELIWYGDESTPPRMKVYITDENPVVPDNFLYFDNSVDTRMIKKMFGKLVFENPKPLEMIKFIISFASPKDAIILDYFAGSGTTAQAVMELNEEDQGNRTFILNTNNESKIMEEVCYPRTKMVMTGYSDIPGIGNSLKFYKADFVGKNNIMRSTDEDKIVIAHNAGEMLAIAENTLHKVKANDYYQVFTNGNDYTVIYFREEMDGYDAFIKEVMGIDSASITAYVFSWESEEEIFEFEDMKNVRIKTIPQPIVEIYKQIYNLI